MKKAEIKQQIQGWYNTAVWYGSVITPLGKMSDYKIAKLASELNVELLHPNCQ